MGLYILNIRIPKQSDCLGLIDISYNQVIIIENTSKSNKKHIFVTERSIESAREIFFKLCQEKGFINEIEY